MMHLMDGGHRRRRRQDGRESIELTGLTALSLGAALVLLPAIGIKALAGRLPVVGNVLAQSREPEEHYLIN